MGDITAKLGILLQNPSAIYKNVLCISYLMSNDIFSDSHSVASAVSQNHVFYLEFLIFPVRTGTVCIFKQFSNKFLFYFIIFFNRKIPVATFIFSQIKKLLNEKKK